MPLAVILSALLLGRVLLLSWFVAGPGEQAARTRLAQIGAAQLRRCVALRVI